jgi:hypothetical protein
MFHSIISEEHRRTVLVLLFVCALILSAVLYGATGSTDKRANKDLGAGRMVSSTSPEMASSARGPRASQRGANVPSFFSTSMPGLNLPFAPGSTTIVNSTAQSPGDAGGCTLSQAIVAANNAHLHPVTDPPECGFPGTAPDRVTHTIILPAGTYTLSTPDNPTLSWGATGLPGITSDLIIQGAGAGLTIIERDPNAAVPFRLMVISDQNVGSLVLSDVTMRGGRAPDGFPLGGALEIGHGPVTLNNVDFTDNTAPWAFGAGGGGAVSWGDGRAGGPLIVNHCTFTNNRSGGVAGAIVAQTITVRNSTFTDNHADYGGGAIYFVQGGGARVSITNSAFLHNTTTNNYGGALWLGGVTTISGSTFDGNTSGALAGAIYASPVLDISDSVVSNNHANDYGGIQTENSIALTINRCNISNNTSNTWAGGVFLGGGGTGSISNSTISGNTSGYQGGGIYSDAVSLKLTNVTIDGNTGVFGGGLYFRGSNDPRPLIINNVTISGNHATNAGGGVFHDGGIATLNNTIIALNTSGSGFAPDIRATSSLTSLGYNLIGIKDGGATYTDGIGDQTGSVATPINPLLGTLQNNGGPTFTRALLAGSTAIDLANPAAPGSGGDSCEATDQRGRRRPDGDRNSGGRCDIGAFEVAVPIVCFPPPSGMIGWWAFDGNPDDIQGSNQALLFGSPLFVAGKVGQSLSFDGLDDHAQVPAAAALDVGPGNGLTFDLWINPAEISTARPVIEWNNAASVEGVHLWMSADFGEGGQGPGSLFVNLKDTSGTHHIFSSAPGVLAANVWQHVAVTYDKTTGVAKIYLNGLIVAQQTLGTTFTPQTSTDLYFGYRPVGTLGGRRFLGNMDEVELFNRALDLTEIQSIYDADSAGKCKPAPSPSPSPSPSPTPTPAVIDIIEHITVNDTPALLPSAMIGVNEQIHVLDTPTLLPSAMIGVNEQIHVLDTPTLLPSAMIGVNEQIHVLDTPALLPSAMIAVNENITVNDAVTTHGILVTFAGTLAPGITSIVPIDPFSVGPAPGGFTITGPAFNITTTAIYTPPVTVCFNLPEITDQNIFSHLKVLHGELNADNQLVLVDRTTGQNFSTRTLCGQVNSLSPFVIAEAVTPTAAPANISGRVTTSDGAPVAGVTIRLSSSQSTETITDRNGSYSFDSVETNGFYTITPARANYTFSPPNRSFSLLGVHTEASFTASASGDQANAIDTTEFFVRQQYLDFLGREPDPPGFNGWVNTINNCAAGDTSCDRVHVSEMFFRSQEFQERGYFVYRFYSSAFGRKPGLAEFTPDMARVSGFLTNDQLEAAKVAFVNDFMSRPAFATEYASLSNAAYVNTLSASAGVTLANHQALIDSLNNGTQTRAQVLRQIAESGEVYQKYYNQALVVMEYFGYLRRDPDALYLNWILELDQTGDPRHMVGGFVNSTEYRQRFGP